MPFRRLTCTLCFVASGFMIAGCTTTNVTLGRHPGRSAPAHYGNLNIPPGHLPPPGQCRIWYPGQPPGHQPPPGDCYELSRQVPPGAWLVEHPAHDRGNIYVNVFDPQRTGRRIEVRIYEAATGIFIRAERR